MSFWSSITGGDVLSGIGSIFSGWIGKKSQDNTNKTNLQIARETNQANRENQEYQNQWNLNMWNTQNEYNNPSQQRSRLENAGLNPIFFGLDGTGNAGALQSAPFTAVNGAPMENSGQFLQQGILNATNTMLDAQYKKAMIDNLKEKTRGDKIENDYNVEIMPDRIESSHLTVTGLNLGNNLTEEQTNNYRASTSKINEEISQMPEYLDLAKKHYDLEKWKAEVNKELSQKQLDFQERELTEKIAVAWYEASLHGREVEIHQQLANQNGLQVAVNCLVGVSQISVNYTTAGKNSKDIQYYDKDKRVQYTGQMAKTAKDAADAQWGTGIVGNVLRPAAGVAQMIRKQIGKTSLDITVPQYSIPEPQQQTLVK